jgi:transposase
MSAKFNSEIAVIGIDIGKNSFHVVGLDRRGAIVLRQKWSPRQVEARFSNLPPCLIGMEACVGAHHLSLFYLERAASGLKRSVSRSREHEGTEIAPNYH